MMNVMIRLDRWSTMRSRSTRRRCKSPSKFTAGLLGVSVICAVVYSRTHYFASIPTKHNNTALEVLEHKPPHAPIVCAQSDPKTENARENYYYYYILYIYIRYSRIYTIDFFDVLACGRRRSSIARPPSPKGKSALFRYLHGPQGRGRSHGGGRARPLARRTNNTNI